MSQGAAGLPGLSWESRSFCGQSFAAVKALSIPLSLGGAVCCRLGKDPPRGFDGLQ